MTTLTRFYWCTKSYVFLSVRGNVEIQRPKVELSSEMCSFIWWLWRATHLARILQFNRFGGGPQTVAPVPTYRGNIIVCIEDLQSRCDTGDEDFFPEDIFAEITVKVAP